MSESPEPRYLHPKILLVDISDDLGEALQAKGYNASVGTFGLPYKTEDRDSYEQVLVSYDLPHFAEQEILFVDLQPERAVNYPTGRQMFPDWQDDWWQKPSRGLIDPRPYAMALYSQDAERILKHGGMLILFAHMPHSPDQVIGHAKPNYHGRKTLSITKEIQASNWGILPSDLANDLDIEFDSGSEIRVSDGIGEFASICLKHLDGARFSCTMEPTGMLSIGGKWLTIATNKYGKPVAGIIKHDGVDKRMGWVFIMPQLKDKASFIQDILFNVFPDLAPYLFPGHEGKKWMHRPEYELPEVLKIEQEIVRLREETELTIEGLESKADEVRKLDGWIHDLITSQGTPLRLAVRKALESLGFKDVVDVDEEVESNGSSNVKMEDLQIRDDKPVLLEPIAKSWLYDRRKSLKWYAPVLSPVGTAI